MVLQDKINSFINRAQSKIATSSLDTSEDLKESFSDIDSPLSIELLDLLASLNDPLLDWTDQDIESTIDYYTARSRLNDIAIVNFEDKSTTILGESAETDSWVPAFTALNQKVDDNYDHFTSEIARVDQKIDDLDFSNLIPQEVLDEIEDNSNARHEHSNKSILDNVTQGHLDAIGVNSAHVADGTKHVTSTQKSEWDNKVTQTQLADGLAEKAEVVHDHEMEDINGLQEAFDGLVPEKGDPGEDGSTPNLIAGTIGDGEYDVEIDNTDPLNPILNFVIPSGEDGADFHIDVYGNASDRLDAQYDNEELGFSLLGLDNGILYFRRPTDDNDDPLPATSTAGWYSSKFMGSDGWSPILGVLFYSDTKTVVTLVGWTGGSGDAPTFGTAGLPTYLGPTGFTQDINQATNIKGNTGSAGPAGKAVFPDAAGILSERDQYDAELKDFMFFDTATGLLYIKRSDTVADWSSGYQWQGDQGETGEEGPPSTTVGSLDYLDFNEQTSVVVENFRLYGDAGRGTLAYYRKGKTTPDYINVTRVLPVRNESGATLLKGTPVSVVGLNTTTGQVTIAKTDPNDRASSQLFAGVIEEDIADASNGYVLTYAFLVGYDTSLWAVGDRVYADPNNIGSLTNAEPKAPAYSLFVGTVATAGTSGIISVGIQPLSKSDTAVSIDGLLDGIAIHTPGITILEDGGVVYADVLNNEDNTKDLPLLFSGQLYKLNTTSGSGVGGAARIALPIGASDIDKVKSTLYVRLNGSTPELAVTTDIVITEKFAELSDQTLFSAARTATDGKPLQFRRANNAVSSETEGVEGAYGLITKILNSIRFKLGSNWISGIDPDTPIVDNTTIQLPLTSGRAAQFGETNVSAFDGTSYLIYNTITNAITYEGESNLINIEEDANGNSLLDDGIYYTTRVYMQLNSGSIGNDIIITRPQGYYTSEDSAKSDPLGLTTLIEDPDVEETIFPLYDMTIGRTGVGGVDVSLIKLANLRKKLVNKDTLKSSGVFSSENLSLLSSAMESLNGQSTNQHNTNEEFVNAITALREQVEALAGASVDITVEDTPLALTTTEVIANIIESDPSTNTDILEVDSTANTVTIKQAGKYQWSSSSLFSNSSNGARSVTVRTRRVSDDTVITTRDVIISRDGYSGTDIISFTADEVDTPLGIYITFEASTNGDITIQSFGTTLLTKTVEISGSTGYNSFGKASNAEIRAAINYGDNNSIWNYSNGHFYRFDVTSTAADDDHLYLKPNDIDIADPGRWVNVADISLEDEIVDNRSTLIGDITDTDPGSGNFKFNNGTQSSATFLYISNAETGSGNIGDLIKDLGADSKLKFQVKGDRSKFANLKIVSVTDATTYQKVEFTYETKGTDFAVSDIVGITIVSAGGGGVATEVVSSLELTFDNPAGKYQGSIDLSTGDKIFTVAASGNVLGAWISFNIVADGVNTITLTGFSTILGAQLNIPTDGILDAGTYLVICIYTPDGATFAIPGNATATPEPTDPPTILSETLAGLNDFIEVDFSEGVYGDASATLPINADDWEIYDFTTGGATAATIASLEPSGGGILAGGESAARFNFTFTGTPTGVETFMIRPIVDSVYNSGGVAMLITETTGLITLINEVISLSFQTASSDTDVFAPILTVNSGVAKWDLGDGTLVETNTPSYTYADGTTKDVNLYLNTIPADTDITNISMIDADIVGEVDLTPYTNFSGGLEFYTNLLMTSLLVPTTINSVNGINVNNTGIAGVWDISGLSNFSDALRAYNCANLTNIINPTTSNVIARYSVQSSGLNAVLDLSGLTGLGGQCDLYSTSITGLLLPTSSTAVTKLLGYSNPNLAGVIDASGMTGMAGQIQFYSCPLMTGFLMPTSSGVITILRFNTCDLTGSWDLSGLTGLGGSIYFYGNSNLTSVIYPISSQTVSLLDGNGCNITGTHDLSGMTGLGGSVNLSGNTLMTGITLPSNTNIFTSLNLGETGVGSIDFSVTPNMTDVDNCTIILSACGMTEAEVDYNLDQIDQISDALYTGRSFQIGLSNAAPSAAGLVSKSNLEAKNWSVDVTV